MENAGHIHLFRGSPIFCDECATTSLSSGTRKRLDINLTKQRVHEKIFKI